MTSDVPARRILLRHGDWSVRFGLRTAVVLAALAVVVSGVVTGGLLLGDLDLSFPHVVASLTGASTDPLANYFVTEVRLPRVVMAVVVGGALGVAGSLFQNVTGNALGSPDILGFTTGAATGALMQIIVFESSTTGVAAGALVGGFSTAALLWLITRSTGLTGQRLVLVGIGVGAGLGALNTLLVARASLVAAQTAAQWLAGSLNAVLWPRTTLAAVSVVVLLIPLVALARPLTMLGLGDDACRAAGIEAQRVRTAAVVVGVALTSVATAATGPIGFVALAAPHISRRLARTPTPGLIGPGLVGAVLVVGSDIIAQRLLAPTQLAVGVVTGALGGTYLVVLLATEWRRSR